MMKTNGSRGYIHNAWRLPSRRLTQLVLICGLLVIPVKSSSFFYSPSTEDTEPLLTRFRIELEAVHNQYRFPGATAAYILPDGNTGVIGVGLADKELEIPMRSDSRMLAASIGKMFVGATVLAMVQEKQLTLDEPIITWLHDRPWFSRLPNHDKITLRHLLNHTSGIRNHVESEQFALALGNRKSATDLPPSPEELIAYVLDAPALFSPGNGWYYSDTGYLLVGLIIEKVTGRSFYAEVRRRFLLPLHLDMTTPSNRLEISGLVAGYVDRESGFGLPYKTTSRPGIMSWHPGVEWAGGGFASNPKDLVVWAKNLFEGRALKGNYLKEMLQSVAISENAQSIRYGIAVSIHQGGPLGPTYGHAGWIPGYSSSLRYYPKHKVAIAFQINTDIGIVDNSTPLFDEMESRLAKVVIADCESQGYR